MLYCEFVIIRGIPFFVNSVGCFKPRISCVIEKNWIELFYYDILWICYYSWHTIFREFNEYLSSCISTYTSLRSTNLRKLVSTTWYEFAVIVFYFCEKLMFYTNDSLWYFSYLLKYLYEFVFIFYTIVFQCWK